MRLRIAILSAVLLCPVAEAVAADPANGARIFKKCQPCHTATDAHNRVGPNLVGIVGRPVATVAGYQYSRAMQNFAAGRTWDDALLQTFLAGPRDTVIGTRMAFYGLKNPDDIADVIAYLKDPAAAPQ